MAVCRKRKRSVEEEEVKTRSETITYPHQHFMDDTNPCLLAHPFEHFLGCGHVVVTSTEYAPCGSNCAHMANLVQTGFFCKACVEEDVNHSMVGRPDPGANELNFLRDMAKVKVKRNGHRACYIGMKIVSIPCDKKGRPNRGYTASPSHAFDTAIPSSGANMFEDISEEPPDEESASEDIATGERGNRLPRMLFREKGQAKVCSRPLIGSKEQRDAEE